MFRFFQAKTPMFHANVDVCIPVCHDSRESCYQQTSPPLVPRQPIVAQQNDPPLPPPLHQTCCCLHCVWQQGAVREDAGTWWYLTMLCATAVHERCADPHIFTPIWPQILIKIHQCLHNSMQSQIRSLSASKMFSTMGIGSSSQAA